MFCTKSKCTIHNRKTTFTFDEIVKEYGYSGELWRDIFRKKAHARMRKSTSIKVQDMTQKEMKRQKPYSWTHIEYMFYYGKYKTDILRE